MRSFSRFNHLITSPDYLCSFSVLYYFPVEDLLPLMEKNKVQKRNTLIACYVIVAIIKMCIQLTS